MPSTACTSIIAVDTEAAYFGASVTRLARNGGANLDIGVFAHLPLTPGVNGNGPDISDLGVIDCSPTLPDMRLLRVQTRSEVEARRLAGHLAADRVAAYALNNGLASGKTLLMNLHSVELALAFFPRVVGIRQGRVAFDLTPDKITPERLGALYAGETGEDVAVSTPQGGFRIIGATSRVCRPIPGLE